MKKNYFNFLFLLLIFSIAGTLLMATLELLIGIEYLFFGCSIIVLLCGIAIIPLRIKQAKENKQLNEYHMNLKKLEKLNKNKFKHKKDLEYYNRHNLP